MIQIGIETKGYFSKNFYDQVTGKLYKCDLNKQKNRKGFNQTIDADVEDMKFEDLEQEIANISGSWIQNLIIGNQEIWNLDRDRPSTIFPSNNPLPSDQRFREDLIWVKY